jgi:predicted  nucleic acid-binding Zn-ribbon protein
MATLIPLLRQLHRLHSLVRDLREQVDRMPQQIKAQKAKLARQEEEQRKAQDALKKLKVHAHEKEVTLKSRQQQIAKYERQINEVTAKKEYDALQHEIAAARQECVQLEDEILAGMLEADERAATLPALEQAIKQARDEYTRFEQGTSDRRGELTGRLEEAQKELKEAEANLPAAVRPQYDRLVQAMGADALAPVRDRACRACATAITAQNYNDLVADRFLCCTCARILYLPE